MSTLEGGARYLIGDVRDRMAELGDGSVDLIMCSPPFLALRSYLPADHPDKAREIGAELTPADFIQTLLELTAEWRRLLAPHGSICIELGDTYSGSGGGGGDYDIGGLRDGQERFNGSAMADRKAHQDTRNSMRGRTYQGHATDGPDARARVVHSRENRPERAGTGADGGTRILPNNFGTGWPLAKSLCLVPELYRIGLVYGLNPLTGAQSPAGMWRARNVVRWHRPNPPVGALGDKYRPATSDMVIACMSSSRYFDLDAVREPHKNAPKPGPSTARNKADTRDDNGTPYYSEGNPAGAPPLDTWIISTEPFKGSHYATWPRDLCVKPIKSMCPEKVCRTCGEPSRRQTEMTEEYAEFRDDINNGRRGNKGKREGAVGSHALGQSEAADSPARGEKYVTTGWSDCGHDNYRRGIVLDPFAGSGTTLAVATGLGRDAIGIDLDDRNQWLARERVGMFLEVEDQLTKGTK